MRSLAGRLGIAVSLVMVLGGCGSSAGPGKTSGGSGGTPDESTAGAGGGGGGGAGGGNQHPDSAVAPRDAPVVEVDATAPGDDGALSTDSGPVATADGSAGADGVAVCWNDPKVIMICHQLENACINCGNGKNPPANTDAVACFDLIKKAYAGMATDADCVKFAMEHVCKPDDATTTGNVCGSLNCQVPGCKDPVKCEVVKQDGESDKCQPYLATCPCK